MAQHSASYPIPGRTAFFEYEIKKSRFLAWTGHAASVDAAEQWIAETRAQYPDARHVCWAWIIGPPDSALKRCSDDGEPSGTAGKPILNVLQHSGYGEIAAIVVRYFGGIKLGAGGLVRAYSCSTAEALKLNAPVIKAPLVTLRLIAEFADENTLRHYIAVHQGQILNVKYREQVWLECQIPAPRKEALLEHLPNSIQLQPEH